ncbi:DUF4913 domain-containing protein [Frondihabitans sp. PhB188]|uniref:DUF4913 domain-containing protein n=1 Tax=Frondihabitans sp. PhB188 TaxID=2485200 RepID=UPI000F4AE107|nr:DUF4913 domain-containing protein [Frondihabitans sp. PhB188]
MAWVQEHFARVEFFTDAQRVRWCPTWWEHPEAVERLKAAWLAYRMIDVSDDLAAVSEWWLHHWDPHRLILFHDMGPFANRDAERGHLSSKNNQRVRPVPALPPEDWNPARLGPERRLGAGPRMVPRPFFVQSPT